MRLSVGMAALAVGAVGFTARAALADPYVDEAKAVIAKATAPAKEWDGPTSGPKLQTGKAVIYIASDMTNGGVLGVKEGFEEACKVAGWKLDVLDGKGSVKDQLAALNQAIAKKPAGIVVGGWNPNVAKAALKKATDNGIALVAWHAMPKPGPLPEYGIFYNVTSDSNEVSRTAAMYAVAQSDGHAHVVIFTDSLYQIALDKANAMKAVIEKCAGCKVMEFIDTPLADTSNRMPQMTFSLLQKYKDDFQWGLGINDLYFDFMGASLKTAGKKGEGEPFNVSAGDGSVSAYQRIRAGDHQAATVPEPLKLHGWQLVDELNRSFSKAQPSGYVTPAHLVTKDNVAFDGGDKNVYDPQNDYQGHYKALWGL
jgi:ribose transport system substrate-binding protein